MNPFAIRGASRPTACLATCLMLSLLPVMSADSRTPSSTTPANTPGRAAIASNHPLATRAGLQILARGGNAFDAAVAVSAVLAVVEPISSSLGGGGFFLLHEAQTGKTVMLDARETAPAATTAAQYLDAEGRLDRDRAINGASSAGIPGLPAALAKMSDEYGRLPLKDALAPAIQLAQDGFVVYELLARGYALRSDVMQRYPGTREVFLRSGKPLAAGDVFHQPELAHTLHALAERGFDGFYRGPVAEQLVQGVNQAGGNWTLQDLADYHVKTREPVTFNYRSWKITAASPPSSGGIALAGMLQMLEGWDLNALDEVQRIHLTAEAMRRAYRDRALYIGDPDFVRVPQTVLTSRDYALGLRASIHPQQATPSDALSSLAAPLPNREGDETTHFSIIDSAGNRVGGTQTVNLMYGSGLIPPGTGVLLNNEMDDFALQPGSANTFGLLGTAANAPASGKRMLSSMTPTFMENDEHVIVLGTPGGARIITMVLLAILGFDAGLDAQQVAALPRWHHQWLPDQISIETGAFSATVISQLKAMGHTVQQPGDTAAGGRGSSHVWGNLQIVHWNRLTHTLHSASDPRGESRQAQARQAQNRLNAPSPLPHPPHRPGPDAGRLHPPR